MNRGNGRDGFDQVPDPIIRTLRLLIRRSRAILVLRGMGAVVAVALASMLVVMAVDAHVVMFNEWPRWLLSLAVYAGMAFSVFWFLIRPLARSYTLSGTARIIEMHHPELQERISSAVEILSSGDTQELKGSHALIAALTVEAIRDVKVVYPRREVRLRTAVPSVLAAVVLIGALGALFLSQPERTCFLVARATIPFVNLPNAFAADLMVLPGDAVIAKNGSLKIQARVWNPSVKSAELRKTFPGRVEMADDMPPAPGAAHAERRFGVTLTRVNDEFRYRVRAGNALSRYYTVRVVSPPAVEAIDVRYDYPEYSRMEPVIDRDSSGTIRALAGTRITVTARLSKDVPEALLRLETPTAVSTITGQVTRAGDGVAAGAFEFEMGQGIAGIWSIRLRDRHGMPSPKFERTLQALPDRPPVARLEHLPRKALRLSPEDALPVFYSAHDDVGLREVALLLEADGRKLPPRLVPLNGGTAAALKAMQGRTVLNLSDADFTNAHVVTFQLRAADTLTERFQGPQFGFSDPCTISLDPAAPAYDRQMLTAETERLKQGLQETQKELTAAKALAPPPAAVSRKPSLTDDTGKELTQTREHLLKAESAARDLARDIQNGYFESLEKQLTDLAGDHIRKAAALTDEVKLTDEPQERGKLAGQAGDEIDKSLASVEDMLKKLDGMAAVLNRAMQLDKLARSQADLAREKLEMERADPAPTAAAAKDWQQDQVKIAGELAKVEKETPDAPQTGAALSRREAAQAAAEAAHLAAQQASLAEESRKLSAQERALSELAAQQERLANVAGTMSKTPGPAAAMKEAAQAIAAGQLREATRRQEAAQASLAQAAAQLKQTPAAARGDAQKVEALTSQQDDLRRKTEELAESRERMREDRERDLAARQRELADGAADLARKSADAVPQSQAAGHAAETTAAAAADHLERGELAAAAEEGRKSGENLDSLARNLQEAAAEALKKDAAAASGDTPGAAAAAVKAASLAERAAEMAEKQQGLNREMKAAAGQPVESLAQEQQDLAQHAGDLAETANRLREEARAIGMKWAVQQQAANAAGQAQEAVRNAGQAGRQLEQLSAPTASSRNPQGAESAQQNAAQALRQAGQSFNALEKALADDARAGAPDAAKDRNMESDRALARAVDHAAEQARDLVKKQADLAADTTRAAAREKARSELAARQQQLADEAQTMPKAASQAEGMKNAAGELKSDNLPAAMNDQAAAQAALAKAADGLRQSGVPEGTAEAERVADLARRQGELRRQAHDLAAAEQNERDASLRRLASEQRGLAAESDKLAADSARVLPRSAPAAQAAERAAQGSAQNLERGELQKAGEKAREAGEELQGLATQLQKATGEAPARGAETGALAERATDMADREQRLAREAQALAGDNPSAALGERQRGVAEDIGELAAAVQAMPPQAGEEGMSAEALPPSGRAASQAEAALQSARNAQRQLEQAGRRAAGDRNWEAAGPAQQQSEQGLRRAQQSLEALGQALAQGAPPPESESRIPEAYQQAEAAAQSQRGANAVRAASQLAEAVRHADARARALGGEPHPQRPDSLPGDGIGILPTAQVDDTAGPAWLARLGIRLRDWLKLPGELRDQVLQADVAEGPEEYRPLIKRYFQEIAKRGEE